jgi:hypothetical protein
VERYEPNNQTYETQLITGDSIFLVFSNPDIIEEYKLRVVRLSFSGQPAGTTDTLLIKEVVMSDLGLMDMVQRYTFRYFWDHAHPFSGMIRERNTSGDIVTTGGTGFGLMALLVGVENGYITRAQASDRIVRILGFLENADRFHGVFPHWMNGRTGDVVPFSQLDNGGDLVETSFLAQGLMCVEMFFDENTSSENYIRNLSRRIVDKIEWDWYSRNDSGSLFWHWSPQHQWAMNFAIRGYNEALITYLLGIASPTHPISPSYWNSGWAKANYTNGITYLGHKLCAGPAWGGPMFFAHYSFLGFDPRNIKDNYCNYWINNVTQAKIQVAYAEKNPKNHKDYSASCWGLTACDGPDGYSAFSPSTNDNGTLAPTAALSSIPYTPKASLDALKYFYLREGQKLFGLQGFYDSYNPSRGWYAKSHIAIDQGPIIIMMQNYRTGLLWKLFMSHPYVQPALDKIGFTKDISSTTLFDHEKYTLYPNPVQQGTGFYVDETFGGDIVKIKAITGQIVQQDAIDEIGYVSIPTLASGVYMVEILGALSHHFVLVVE